MLAHQPPFLWIIAAVLALAMTGAAVVDARTYRIPNLITYPAMAILVLLQTVSDGWPGALQATAGLLLAGACMLPPFLLGVMGAGDVKLMAVAGAALGTASVLTVLIFTSVAGGLQAVLMVSMHVLRGGSAANRPKVCYGVAIAVGTLAALAWHVSGRDYIVLF